MPRLSPNRRTVASRSAGDRVIGSIRRECLNHSIVLNERHLHRVLAEYFDYYHNVFDLLQRTFRTMGLRFLRVFGGGKSVAVVVGG